MSAGIFAASSSISPKRPGMGERDPSFGTSPVGGAGAFSAGRTIVPDSSIQTELGMLITPKTLASRW